MFILCQKAFLDSCLHIDFHLFPVPLLRRLGDLTRQIVFLCLVLGSRIRFQLPFLLGIGIKRRTNRVGNIPFNRDITLFQKIFHLFLKILISDLIVQIQFLKLMELLISILSPSVDLHPLKRGCSRRNYLLSEPSQAEGRCSDVQQSG